MNQDLRERFEELCALAVEVYGIEAQMDMVVEECAELISAIQKRKRAMQHPTKQSISKDTITPVIEEGVDVQVMNQQLWYIYFPSETWDRILREKLDRLEEKLAKSGYVLNPKEK